MKNRIVNYFKGRSWSWWASNTALVAIVVILIVPSWRVSFQAFVGGLFLRSPDWEEEYNVPINQDTWAWKLQPVDGSAPATLGQMSDGVVFINIWATWCPPCVSELPSIEDLYKGMGEEVRFIIVSEESMDKVREFTNAKGFDLPFYTTRAVPSQLRTGSYPTTIVMKDGAIIHRLVGSYDWDSEDSRARLMELLRE